MWRSRIAVAVIGGAAVAGVIAPGAASGSTALTYRGCFSNDGSRGCQATPLPSISYAHDIAMSPDGSSVYATSAKGLTIFDRAPSGELIYRKCIANRGAYGCDALPDRRLGEPGSVTVSPDAKSLYVTNAGHQATITRFKRQRDGDLVYAECLAGQKPTARGCDPLPLRWLTSFGAITVTPDGRSAYAVGWRYGGGTLEGIFRFKRARNGALTYVGCLASRDSGDRDPRPRACRRAPRDTFSLASTPQISPDGRSLYVGSYSGVAEFRRSSNGALTYVACNGPTGRHKRCARYGHGSLEDSGPIAISLDGRSVYVGAGNARAINRFDRAPNGRLSFRGCVANFGRHGCRRPAADSLAVPIAIHVTRDGTALYLGSFQTTLTAFDRSPSGGLTFNSCFSQGERQGCVREEGFGMYGMAVSPGDNWIYTAGEETVAMFSATG